VAKAQAWRGAEERARLKKIEAGKKAGKKAEEDTGPPYYEFI
jgi:hypothetical protein